MANSLYLVHKQLLTGDGAVVTPSIRTNWETATTINVILIDSADYTVNVNTHQDIADVPSLARVATGAIAGRTATISREFSPGEAQFLSTSFPAFVKNGTNFPVFGLAFDAAADEAAFWDFRAVKYGSGNLTINVDWYADTATSGDVVWAAQIAAITPDTDTQDVETKALATANSVTDTHLGTVGQRLHRATITVSNLDALALDDDVWLRIARDADNAADTMTGDAIFVKAVVSYSDV